MKKIETIMPNSMYVRRIVDYIKCLKLRKFYCAKAQSSSRSYNQVVYMADGRMHHGGLSDRLCGMISAYNYCKKNGYEFKIHFTNPFLLGDILSPGTYDWRIKEEEISYNIKEAVPVYVSNIHDYHDAEMYFKYKLRHVNNKQIHLYTNAHYFNKEEFHILFSELFKPGEALQQMLDDNIKLLPQHYVSLTFRFQQLLGDFQEDGFPTIESKEGRESLINKCLSCVEDVYKRSGKTVLVTSDSKTFLMRAQKFEYVYVIPGTIRHMDYNQDRNVNIAVDLKSFVDFYLIANADVLYNCCYSPLFGGGFAYTASFVNNREFIQLYDE